MRSRSRLSKTALRRPTNGTTGKGAAIIAGTFLGQANETPEALARQRANIIVGNMPGTGPAKTALHPLGGFLAAWAKLSVPDLKSSEPLDLQQLVADTGRMVFLMNWETSDANVELSLPLDQPARLVREITGGERVPVAGTTLRIRTEVPAQGVKVYRIDY